MCLVNKNSANFNFFTEILEDDRDFAKSTPAALESTQIKKETIDIGRSGLSHDSLNTTFYFTGHCRFQSFMLFQQMTLVLLLHYDKLWVLFDFIVQKMYKYLFLLPVIITKSNFPRQHASFNIII